MPRILVVEDNEAINGLISLNLTVAGHEVFTAMDGHAALGVLESGQPFELAIVDIMLPGVDGFELFEPLNARGVPVIYLTARGDIESKVRGLRSGAEDYIVKPFEVLELLVRVEKVLERRGLSSPLITLGELVIDTAQRSVRLGDTKLNLRPREYELLLLLARHQNIAMPREKLLAMVWGADFLGETRTVDVHVAQLRKKTGLSIVALPKVGYRLEC